MSILEYNGNAAVAVADKVCLGISSHPRFATGFEKVVSIHEKLYTGISGLATEAQSLFQRLQFGRKLHQLRENRSRHSERYASPFFSLPYGKRPRKGDQTTFTPPIAWTKQSNNVDVTINHPGKLSEVKICGVTNVEDALVAAEAGANYIGMILWPKSRRSISVGTAKAIAHSVRVYNVEPVGVFVDEDAMTIENCCKVAGIDIVQLHGERARSSLPDLSPYLRKIYVIHVDGQGVIQTNLPSKEEVDWLLLDSLQGGSGHSFDWRKLKYFNLGSKYKWFLAGGLNPDNVSNAISILGPDIVDVSSGVTGPDGILKDHKRILAFVNAVKNI